MELEDHPEIWDEYAFRTQDKRSPHRECSDIWVRYNAIENLGEKFNDKHEAVWYRSSDKIPAVKRICADMLSEIGADEFGGVLITRIPPHSQVYPHSDHGWHAEYYEKFAILLRGNAMQTFCFTDAEHRCEPGDSFTFNNQATHWVLNPTDVPRETLIICATRH